MKVFFLLMIISFQSGFLWACYSSKQDEILYECHKVIWANTELVKDAYGYACKERSKKDDK